MNRAIVQFTANLESAKHLGIIFEAFSDKVTEAIQLDELLRAEIVFGVSALDCYIHDVVRIGMKKLLTSVDEPNGFQNFGVSMHFVKGLLQASNPQDRLTLFDQEVRRLHGFKSFQKAENISQGFALIGVRRLWDKAAVEFGIPAADVKTKLNLIVDRRNKIAHEGDIDPTLGVGNKYPIDLAMVSNAIDFIGELVAVIHKIVNSEIP